jgi:hypothetical protein
MKLKKNENRTSLKGAGVTDMTIATNLVVLTPAFVGVSLHLLRRFWLPEEGSSVSPSPDSRSQSFSYPSGIASVMFAAAIVIPVITFLLPDSIVLDVRPLFNLFAIFASVLLFFCWLYFRKYQVTVGNDFIEYGAFKTERVDLRGVTEIRYHWVNNGINLKLFAGAHRIALFEGGIARFDDFAKCVRSRLPNTVTVKTEGRAAF